MNNLHRIIAIIGCLLTSFANADILLGQSADLTGPNKEITQAFNLGVRAQFDYINKNGGIAGNYIKLITLDNKSDQETALDNANELINTRRVDALFGVIGDNTTYAIAPLADAKSKLLFAPSTGLPTFTFAENTKNTVIVRSSYQAEIERILRHIGTPLEDRTIYVLYDGEYASNELLPILQYSIDQKGGKPPRIVDLRGKDGVKDAAKLIKHSPPTAIIYLSTQTNSSAAARAIQTELGYTPLYQFMLSSNNFEALQGRDKMTSLMYSCPTSISPSQLRGIAQAEWHRINAVIGQKQLANPCKTVEGFIAALMFTQTMKSTGGKTDVQSVKRALAAMGSIPLGTGGYSLDYTQNQSTGSVYSDIGFMQKRKN
jgi:branched-chain amino acid transport system substrate-binding protein